MKAWTRATDLECTAIREQKNKLPTRRYETSISTSTDISDVHLGS